MQVKRRKETRNDEVRPTWSRIIDWNEKPVANETSPPCVSFNTTILAHFESPAENLYRLSSKRCSGDAFADHVIANAQNFREAPQNPAVSVIIGGAAMENPE
jgi:hypothetical protein